MKYKPPKDHPWRKTMIASVAEARSVRRKIEGGACPSCGAGPIELHYADCNRGK